MNQQFVATPIQIGYFMQAFVNVSGRMFSMRTQTATLLPLNAWIEYHCRSNIIRQHESYRVSCMCDSVENRTIDQRQRGRDLEHKETCDNKSVPFQGGVFQTNYLFSFQSVRLTTADENWSVTRGRAW
eukprot:4656931-Amphidinium_carterae.1